MKKSVLSLVAVIFAVLPGSVFGGYYDAPDDGMTYSSGKSPVDEGFRFSNLDASATCACFEAGTIDIDIFAGYAWAKDSVGPYSEDGFTGGLGVQFFYTEMFGTRLQGTYWGSEREVGTASGSMIFRYPIKRIGLAPYVYGGPGGLFSGDGGGEWTGHAGVGLDYRFDNFHCIGVVLDFRRVWAEKSDGFSMLTLGLRVSI